MRLLPFVEDCLNQALVGLTGLIVFYDAMNPKSTSVGRVAFWFAIVGAVLMTGLMIFVEAAIVPVLAVARKVSQLLKGISSYDRQSSTISTVANHN